MQIYGDWYFRGGFKLDLDTDTFQHPVIIFHEISIVKNEYFGTFCKKKIKQGSSPVNVVYHCIKHLNHWH